MLPVLALALAAVSSDPIGFVFENPFFIADLSARELRTGAMEDNGTLRSLTIKSANFKVQRSKNRMHWAPSIQRTGAKGYNSIGIWNPVQEHKKSETKDMVRLTRSGYIQEYPEIHLWAEYDFLKKEPYFLFRSRMKVEKPIEVFWLRNQEMTMDHVFTHVAFPGEDGKPVVVDFDARKPILAKKPLPVDVAWIAFVNVEKGFGFGQVTLKHKASVQAGEMTSVNDGVDPPARYWDRRLINQVNTKLAPGETFEEESAYVVFDVVKERPLEKFLAIEKRIRSRYKK